MKNLKRPFEDLSESSKNIEYNFSDFEEFDDSFKNKINQSKSSQNIELIIEEHEEITNRGSKNKKLNAEQKRAAFKANKLGKTQCFQTTKALSGDLSEDAKPNVADLEEESAEASKIEEVERRQSEPLQKEKSSDVVQFRRGNRLKSFKTMNLEERRNSCKENSEDKNIDKVKITTKQSENKEKADKNLYRKQRKNRDYKLN